LFCLNASGISSQAKLLKVQMHKGREVVAANLLLFIVEMYTPDEIVEARRSFSADNIESALENTKPWIHNSGHNAMSFRVVDRDGVTVFDKLVTDFNYAQMASKQVRRNLVSYRKSSAFLVSPRRHQGPAMEMPFSLSEA
jgi:hypothetical protein